MAEPYEYLQSDLDIINAKRIEMGINPIDKFGAEVHKTKAEKVPKPTVTPKRVEGAPRTKELEQYGKFLSETEIEAQRNMELEFRNRVQEEASKILNEMPPEMKDAMALDPDFGKEIANLALQNTLSDVQSMQHLVPGFKPKDWGDEPPTWEMFGSDPIEAVFGAITPLAPGRALSYGRGDEPAPPLELPMPEATTWTEKLEMAAAPQTRLGAERAKRVEILTAPKALKDPNEYAVDQGIDLGAWNKWKQEAIQGEFGEDDREEKILADREQYANYKGFYAAYHTYLKDNPGLSARDVVAGVQEELAYMQKIIAGEGSDDDYIIHDVGPKGPADPWYQAFSRTRVDGKVPNLSDTQKAFIEASTVQKREFFMEEIPYMRAEQKMSGYQGDPDFTVQRFDYGEVGQPGYYDPEAEEKLIGHVPAKPGTEEYKELESEYSHWLKNRGLTDYWALDFIEDPEKYASGYLWNKAYPSGASVEGPVGWTFRSAMILPNIASRTVYEGGSAFFDTSIADERMDELPENQLYKGHPFLKNIAHNRGLMNDMHDVFYYSDDYQDWAVPMGAAGLLVDVLITPFDPGISQAAKGTTAGLRGYKTIRTLGGTRGTAATVGVGDFLKQAGRGYADQSILGMVGKYRFMDPLDQATAHSYQWLRDEAAFKRAWEGWSKTGGAHTADKWGRGGASRMELANLDETQRFHKALDEARTITVGGKTSRFYDDAAKKGLQNTIIDMNSTTRWKALDPDAIHPIGGIGPRYDRFLDDLDAYARGTTNVLPNPELTRKLIEGGARLNDEFGDLVRVIGDEPELVLRAIRNGTLEEYNKFMNLITKPLHHKMGSRIATHVLENSTLLKGGFSGLNMITPKLFLTADDMPKLAKAMKQDEVGKSLLKIAEEGKKGVGLYPFYKTIGGQAGRRSFRPRQGSFIRLDPEQQTEVVNIANRLYESGLITRYEYDNVLAGLAPKQFAARYAKGKSAADVEQFFEGSYLSFDNLRMLMNGNIEKIAYQNRLGLTTEVLEEATTRTKVQLMNAYEARHLSGNWFNRQFKKIPWIGDKGSKRWGAADFEGMPLHAVIKVKELQGQLANIAVILRKELKDIMTNPTIAKQYGLEGMREISRDDAIAAAMLGPIASRSNGKMNSTIRNMVKIIAYNPKATALDVMDVFRSASVVEARLFENMSAVGRDTFQRLLHGEADTIEKVYARLTAADNLKRQKEWDEFSALNEEAQKIWAMSDRSGRASRSHPGIPRKPQPVKEFPEPTMAEKGYIELFREARTAEDYFRVYDSFYDELEKIFKDVSTWKNTDYVPKLVDKSDFADITAGLFHINKSLELADNAIDDIIRSWDGFDVMARNVEAMDDVLREASKGLDDWISESAIRPAVAGEERLLTGAERHEQFVGRYSWKAVTGTEATTEEIQRLGQVKIMDAIINRIKRLDNWRAHPDLVPIIGVPRVVDDWAIIVEDLFQVQPHIAKRLATDLANDSLKDMNKLRRDIMSIKEGVDNKAFNIMRRHRLNASNVNEGLDDLSIMLSDLEKYTGKFKGDKVDTVPHTDEEIVAFKSKIEKENQLSGAEWRKHVGEQRYGQQLSDEVTELNEELIRIQAELDREKRLLAGAPDHGGDAWYDAMQIERLEKQWNRTNQKLERLQSRSEKFEQNLNGRMYNEFLDILQTKLFGKTVSKKVRGLRDQAQTVNNVRKALYHLYKTPTTGAHNTIKFFDNFLAWMTQMRYTLLLSSRVAFHSINMFTAPQIIWGTLGGRGSLASLPIFGNLKTAHKVWQVGSVRSNPLAKGMKWLARPEEHGIALIDKMGRPYTYRDIWELAIAKGGLRSQTAIIINAAQYQSVLDDTRFTQQYSNYVKKGLDKWLGRLPMEGAGAVGLTAGALKGGLKTTEALGTAHIGAAMGGVVADFGAKYFPALRGKNKWGRFLTDMTEYEDQYFRLTQVIDGLKRGEDPFIALSRGKHALYDYGSLNEAEKWASSRLFMFYAFFKLNMATTAGVLISNPKRFANIFRSSQAPYLLFKDKEDPSPAELDFYKHHFLFSRPILDYTEGVDKTSHFTVMPPVPLLDGMQTAAEILHAPTFMHSLQPMRDLFNPELKLLLGQESRIEWKKKYVDPVDMYLLDESGLMEWFWNVWVGEVPTPKLAVAGDVHYDGYTYHLSPEAMKKYLYFKNVVAPFMTAPNVMGGDTIPMTHWTAEFFGMESPKLYGKAYGEEGEGSLGGVLGLKRRVGTIPIPAQRTMVIKEVQKRLEEIEGKKGGEGTYVPDNSDIDALDYISPQTKDNLKRVREMQRQDELRRREQEQR